MVAERVQILRLLQVALAVQQVVLALALPGALAALAALALELLGALAALALELLGAQQVVLALAARQVALALPEAQQVALAGAGQVVLALPEAQQVALLGEELEVLQQVPPQLQVVALEVLVRLLAAVQEVLALPKKLELAEAIGIAFSSHCQR